MYLVLSCFTPHSFFAGDDILSISPKLIELPEGFSPFYIISPGLVMRGANGWTRFWIPIGLIFWHLMTRRRFVSFTCYAVLGPRGLCKIMPWKAADLWWGETVRSLMFGFFEADQIPQSCRCYIKQLVDTLTLIRVKHKGFQLIHWLFHDFRFRHFDDFNGAMTNYYGTDFSCMRAEFLEEQRKWPNQPTNQPIVRLRNVRGIAA